MTKEQFDKLKIGDRVYIPHFKPGEVLSTEVLGIDRIFNRINVLCHSKTLSYRYVAVETRKFVAFVVGTYKELRK